MTKTILRILALCALTVSALAADITQAVVLGKQVTMVASSTGTEPITYQWFKDGSPVFQGTTFVIASFQASHVGAYTVRATNAAGSADSPDRVVLSIVIPPSPPKITVGLANVTVIKGDDKTLRVAVEGNPAPTLQWRQGVSNIRGATHDFLTISSAKPKDAGTYAVRATNEFGWVESGAVVTVANR